MYRAAYWCLRKVRSALPERHNAASGEVLRWAREKLVPKSKVWVQVEHGIAQGLWMRLELPDETFLWRGEHEPCVQHVLASVVNLGWVTYDVGSYLGFFALGMARAVGATGQVIAFEPDPENTGRLRQHVERNHLEKHVRIVQAAAWHRSAAQISYQRGGKARSQGGVAAEGIHPVLASGEQILVRGISLDDFVAGGNPVPQLLKIDVEGGEAAVLAGAEKLITQGKPLIICEVHHATAAGWVEEWFSGRDYRLEWTIPPEGFPRHLVAKPAPQG